MRTIPWSNPKEKQHRDDLNAVFGFDKANATFEVNKKGRASRTTQPLPRSAMLSIDSRRFRKPKVS